MAAPGRAPARDYYDRDRYWRDVAGPLADRALARDSTWAEIFDPAAVRGGGAPGPVEAVLVALAAESVARTRLVSLPRAP